MMSPAERQWIVDEEHLKLLTICHWVLGGITAFFSLFPFIHLVIGLGMLSGKFPGAAAPAGAQIKFSGPSPEESMRAMGMFFIVFSSVIIGVGMTFAGLILFSARSIGRRRHRTFSLVVAAISCLLIPFGTLLGMFTLVVLTRPTVAARYEGAPGVGT